jgi:TRAP-type C4-dicarboxylate transport system permease small subunit
MKDAVQAVALAAAAINLAAAAWGGWRWWKVEPSGTFWILLRAGQAGAAVFALVCGVAALTGHRPDDGLFWLYVALPLGVAFVAEQLRILSAQTVLDARGIEDAQAMGRLPESQQHSVVLAIVRREIGVMSAEAAAVGFLLVRAAMTAGGV